MVKIVTIGGGSGMPVVNEALLLAGVKYITSVVTVMDSGGVTGRMRTDARGKEVAYSDGLRVLLSLVSPKKLNDKRVQNLIKMLRRRNDREQDLGYTIFSHYFNQENGFSEIQNLLENLTGLKFCGQILPVTTQPCQLVFKTLSGQIYRGEHELDDKRMSADTIVRMWLEPEVTAYIKSVEAIAQADVIIYSCGSLHGSILVNFLPKGIKQAFRLSHAKKILITNLASTKNETDKFKPEDYRKIFQQYSELSEPIDIFLAPKMTQEQFEKKYPKITRNYALEHSHFLGWEKEMFDNHVIFHEATTIDPKLGRLRHDPKKLSLVFKRLFK